MISIIQNAIIARILIPVLENNWKKDLSRLGMTKKIVPNIDKGVSNEAPLIFT